MFGTRFDAPTAPAIDASLAQASLVLVGYGSPSGSAALEARRRSLTERAPFGATAAATLFGKPRLEDVVAGLVGSPILAVPLLMARGLTYDHLVERLAALDLAGRMVLCPEIGGHPKLAEILCAQADRRLQAEGWRAEDTGLLLVGHGTPRNQASRRSTECLAARIAAGNRFAETRAAYLEEAPSVEEACDRMSARHLLAVGCFIENGRHVTRDLPVRLDACREHPVYAGAVGDSPWIQSLIIDQARLGLRTWQLKGGTPQSKADPPVRHDLPRVTT